MLLTLPTNWKCAKAISLIFLATTFFSYSAWDWSSFTERRPRGVVLDFRRNGRPTLELEAQIFLVSGAFEEHKARNLDPGSLGVAVLLQYGEFRASFVCKSFLASPLVTTVILVTDQVTFPYLPCSWWFSNLAA